MAPLVGAFLISAPAFAPAFADWSVDAMNIAIDNTNVVVNRGCSGTLVAPGMVLTAHHCIADQYETIEREKISDDGVVTKEKVRRFRDGTIQRLYFVNAETVTTITQRVRLVATDTTHDLALLHTVTSISGEPAVMACNEPRRGDTIYVVGNPMGMLYSNVTKGIVSSNDRSYELLGLDDDITQAKAPLMQVDAGIVGGNSGGAVYNADGEFVGVPVLGHRFNEVIAFAVPLGSVRAFLTAHGLGSLWSRCATH